MDTKQKNREVSVPQSAQQKNGAVRSAEDQRTAAGRPPVAPEEKRTVAPRKKAQSPEAAPRKAAEGAKRRPAQKKPVPQKKAKPAEEKVRKDAARDTQNAKSDATRKKQEKLRQKKPLLQLNHQKKPEPQEPAYTKGLPDSVSTKKRAYGNSKPKKKTALDMVNDAVKRSSDRKAEKIRQRQAEREKGGRPKQKTQINAPAVIYTEPQAFNRNRFLVQMLTVLAVVVALVMGLSVFFKVEVITVSGAEVYSPWAVRDASGIEEGDNLLTFSHARAGAQIKANLPYVKSVRFGIKLPDTVNIIIEEEDVVYAIKTHDGTWWLMTSAGRMVEQTNSAVAANYTQILGVTVQEPVPNERAVATESAAVYETNEQGETVPVPVSVTGAQRLNTALQIVTALEDNDIVGSAASVDVTRLEDIILWYGTRFQVNLGDSSNLAYKVACMNDCILQMSEYQTGILDISFTIWPNQVGFTPFS